MKVATVQVNYYEILGVEPTARLEEIRNAYKKLCLKMHPDRALINKELEMKRKMGDHEVVEGVPEGDEEGAHVDDTVDRRGRGAAAASEEEAGAGDEAGAAAAAPGSSPSSTRGSSSSSSCNGGKKGTQEQGAEKTSNSSATSSAAPTMKNEEAGNSSSSTSSRPKKTAARNSVSSPVDGCEGGSRGGGATKGKVNIEFYQVQDAWKTLSNPSRRFLYDMRNFGKSEEFPECDESYLLDLERAQAEKDLHQMGSYLTKVVTRETRAKGVIIMDAWYGDMSILSKFYLAFNEKSSPNRVGEDGLYVDVRVATQCQVDYKSHRLIMSGGDSTSRSDLPGYYNPIPLSLRNSVELGLFIRYQFNDEVHEVLANDTEPIYIPKKSHTISNIAKRIRQEQEHEEQLRQAGVGVGEGGNGKNFIPSKIKKVLTGGNDKKQPMGDRVIACHLGLCALFAGLYLYKERDVLKNVLAEVCGWKTDRVLEFVDGGKVRMQI